ncbi:hypothetical protein Tco_1546436 [Tanacetum coccineum]
MAMNTISNNGDHGSYDTLIQGPYGAALRKLHSHRTAPRTVGSHRLKGYNKVNLSIFKDGHDNLFGTVVYSTSNDENKHNTSLDEVSITNSVLRHFLKQYQKEVNELRAERMAQNDLPLALVAYSQTLLRHLLQSSKLTNSYAATSKASLLNQIYAKLQDTKAKRSAKHSTHPTSDVSFLKKDIDHEPKQSDWLAYTDDKYETRVDAHYSYMAKIQEVPNANSAMHAEHVDSTLDTDDNVFANTITPFWQSESLPTHVFAMSTGDSNVI